jgi:hypothetical protein
MSRNLIYDQWIPFKKYEKHECDIKLKDGTIIKHVNPNAGMFYGVCGRTFEPRHVVNTEDVAEIMYRKYYGTGLCNGDCNAKPKE